MPLEIDAIKVVLNIFAVNAIDLDEVHGHILPMPAAIPEPVIAVCSGHILWQQRLIERITVLSTTLASGGCSEMHREIMHGRGAIVVETGNRVDGIGKEGWHLWRRRRRIKRATIEFMYNKFCLQQLRKGARSGIYREMCTQLAQLEGNALQAKKLLDLLIGRIADTYFLCQIFQVRRLARLYRLILRLFQQVRINFKGDTHMQDRIAR